MELHEYADRFARFSSVVWVGGVPWRLDKHSRLLYPLSMPHTTLSVTRPEIRRAMRLTGSVMARWTDAWRTEPCEWWWVCCDESDYDLSKLTLHGRRDTRKGLERSEVKQVRPSWLAENAYETFVAGSGSYQSEVRIVSRERFYDWMIECEEIGSEAWACFVEGQMAAYVTCDVVDGVACVMTGRFNRAFGRARPTNALFYTLTRHYMVERGLQYVTGGCRVVFHETRIQDFLENMGYKQIYCPLRVEFGPLLTLAAWPRIHRWGKYLGLEILAPRIIHRLTAVGRLAEIAELPRHRTVVGLL